MGVINITPDNEKWFRPIIPARFDINDENTYMLGAVSDGAACGALVCELNSYYLNITYIAVSPNCRRQGAASAMLALLCESAAKLGIPVLCTFEAADKTVPLYLFFAEAKHFTMTEQEGYSCIVPFSQIKDSYLSSFESITGRPVPFFSLCDIDRRKFLNELHENNIYFLTHIGKEEFVLPLCLCYKKDGRIVSAVFVKQEGERDLNLCFAYNEPGYNKHVAGLFAELRRIALDMYGEGTKLYIEAVSDKTTALVDKIFPKRILTGSFYTASFDMEAYTNG